MYDILKGIRVLDFSRYMSGPYCGQILADMGAEVIKVEKINGGDETRGLGPWVDGQSLYYPAFNRNKKSVALDFRSDEGKKILRQLAEKADVILENFRPGTLAKMGIGYETMKDVNPGLIVASITGFGQEGPYKDRAAFDSIVTHMSGMSWIQPELNAPVKSKGAISDITASIYTALSIVLALYQRQKTGRGQWIDCAMFSGSVAYGTVNLANYAMTGNRGENSAPDSAPQGPCRAKDGWLSIHVGTGPMFARVKKIISDPRLHEEKYNDVKNRVEDRQYLMSVVEDWMKDKTCAEVEEIFVREGIPVGILGTWDRLYNDKQLNFRNDIVKVNVPGIGEVPYCAFPVKFSDGEQDVPNTSAKLGEHNVEILTQLLGMSAEDAERFRMTAE